MVMAATTMDMVDLAMEMDEEVINGFLSALDSKSG
jgi:hypothetical protein